MAKRRSTKMIPPDYSIGKDVFPVIPIRTFMTQSAVIQTSEATIVAGNVGQEVELDLDFESNEVFDVLAVEVDYTMNVGANASTNPANMTGVVALTDDPDKATETPIHTEDTFEGDQSFVWFKTYFADYGTAVDSTDRMIGQTYNYFIFEQPWTVARNLKWIMATFATAADDFGGTARITIWGRRRNASDSEFKSIIYRQRF